MRITETNKELPKNTQQMALNKKSKIKNLTDVTTRVTTNFACSNNIITKTSKPIRYHN